MTDQAELIRRHVLEVFAETDPVKREAVIAELYADDVTFYDPEGEVHGRAALNSRVTDLLAQGPGLTFRIARSPRVARDLATVDWELAPGDGPAVVSGTDVALFRNARIATLYTVVG